MAVTRYGVQNPGANVESTILTAADAALISVIATNKHASADASVSVFVIPNGATLSSQYAYIAYNLQVNSGNSVETHRFAVNVGDVVKVVSSITDVSFTATGIPQTDTLPESSAQTFTNKTIDANLNTITNFDLNDLQDVVIATPSTGQTITYDSLTGQWTNSSSGSSLPSQTGNAGKYLTTDGTTASWGVLDLSIYATLASPTFTGTVTVPTPINNTDATTKAYVDSIAQGLHVHAPSVAATTASLATLTGGTVTYNNGTNGVGATLTLQNPLTTLDGYTLSNGNRILVKNESNSAFNGIYTWATGGTVLTRATDSDTPTELAGGDFTFVQNGTLYNDTGWVLTDPVTTVGTSPVTF